jgi:4-hydroxybenzoate polyprenyltransferase
VGFYINIANSVNNKLYGLFAAYLAMLQNIKSEFIYGGYLTSLGCPAFVLSVAILLNSTIDWPVLLIAYLTPLIVYSFNYYGELQKDMATNPERAIHLSKKARLYPLILGAYVLLLAVLLILFANYIMMTFVLILLFCGIFYTILFKDLTRQLPGFKGIYIASVWALAGAFFFNFHYSLSWDIFSVLMFLFIFLRGIINVTFFDIKDIESDGARGLKTLPVMLGRERTLKFLHILNIFAFIPLFVGIYAGIIPAFALTLIVFYFYDFYYLKKADVANPKGLRMISYTLADAEFILWPIVLIIGKVLFFGL